MTDKDETATVVVPKSNLVVVAQSKVGLHIREARYGLRAGNATWMEYFRVGGKVIGDDNLSDGVCRLRSGKFSYRVGIVLFGEFDTPQAAELEHQKSGGFCSLATYRRICILAEQMQATTPPEKID